MDYSSTSLIEKKEKNITKNIVFRLKFLHEYDTFSFVNYPRQSLLDLRSKIINYLDKIVLISPRLSPHLPPLS